jgi:hypothetical protein
VMTFRGETVEEGHAVLRRRSSSGKGGEVSHDYLMHLPGDR